MRCLGLINARAGSKGIPGKNIKHLNGRPLIEYSIEAGLKASRITRVVVSTDSLEIAEIARVCGADTPFMRPPELASDTALQFDAIRHAVETLEEQGDFYEVIVLIQPTCPLRNSTDIDGAIKLMEKSGAESVISVMTVHGQHPLTMYAGDPEADLQPLIDGNKAGTLRQKFPPVFWRNGAIYGMKRDLVINEGSLYGAKTVGYLMPAERSINIDEPVDWIIAETLLRQR